MSAHHEHPPSTVDVESLLRSLASSEAILYFPNPGNAGDSYIAAATLRLLLRTNVPFELCDAATATAETVRDRVVVLGGGGNLIPRYPQVAALLARIRDAARRIVLLPHSVCGHEELLAALGPDTDLVAREPVSYEHLRRHARLSRIWLAHDLVLGEDARALLGELNGPLGALGGALAGLLVPGRSRESLIGSVRAALLRARRLALVATGRHARGVLHCFREDDERTGLPVPLDNFDVSRWFARGVTTP